MRKLLAAATLMGAAVSAQATTIVTVDVLGLIQYSRFGDPVGSEIKLSFSYALVPSGAQWDPRWDYYSLTAPYLVSGAFGDFSFHTQGLNITVGNDIGSNVQDLLVFSGDLNDADSFACDSCYFGLTLGSDWWNTEALTSTSLPYEIDLAKFDAEGFRYGGIYSYTAPQGEETMLDFEVLALTTRASEVAEPMGAYLAGAAVAAMLANGRRRSRRLAAKSS